MGTKEDPGKYDCYAKLEPGEPYFTLRGKDPIAPYLVRIWSLTRNGRYSDAIRTLLDAMDDAEVLSRVSHHQHEKLKEAMRLAEEMEKWPKKVKLPPPV